MKRWDKLASNRVLERDNDVLLQLGTTIVTRKDAIEKLKTDSTRSLRALDKAFNNNKYKPKSAKDLARRVSMDEMFEVSRIGELAVRVFGFILIEYTNVNPWSWANNQKLSTRYSQAKTRVKKRRSKKVPQSKIVAKTGNVVVGKFRKTARR